LSIEQRLESMTGSLSILLRVRVNVGAASRANPLDADCRLCRIVDHGIYNLNSKGKTMKTMTCKQLGGKCDQKLSASSWDEMVKVMTKHVMEKHPDVAKQMETMHNEDPKRWAAETKPKWDAAAEA
jgi:predicted small metal-binding protein